MKTPNDQKRFLCIWGDGYTNNGETAEKILSGDAFHDEVGYTNEMQERIDRLEIGQAYDMTAYMPLGCGVHSVVRINDYQNTFSACIPSVENADEIAVRIPKAVLDAWQRYNIAETGHESGLGFFEVELAKIFSDYLEVNGFPVRKKYKVGVMRMITKHEQIIVEAASAEEAGEKACAEVAEKHGEAAGDLDIHSCQVVTE